MATPTPTHADKSRKEEYFEILHETIKTNPYRKAATAMASAMSKHGITSDARNVLEKSSGLPEKKCALTRELKLAQSCNQKLNITKGSGEGKGGSGEGKNGSGEGTVGSGEGTCGSGEGTGGSGEGKGGSGDANKSTSDRAMKDCHLSSALSSAKRCMYELREAKESFSKLVARDDQLTRGIRKTNPTEDHKQLAHVALSITNLCREAFFPAHRLNQIAIALYCAEDFLRYPTDIRTFDLQSSKCRIKLPDVTFNNATVMKLRQVVDLAAETYNKFNGKGRMGEELQEILFCILRGYQDFYAATLGCQEIFKVLLYTEAKDKAYLQQFLLALSAMDRSDVLAEIQDLRRILDEIVIFLEKLSWGSFVVYRLAGGSAGNENLSSSHSDDQLLKKQMSGSPTYPLLKRKGTKKQPKQKKVVTEKSVESNGVKLKTTQASSYNMEVVNDDTKDNTSKPVNTMKKVVTEKSVESNGVKLKMMQASSYNMEMVNDDSKDNISKPVNTMKKSKFSKRKMVTADVGRKRKGGSNRCRKLPSSSLQNK